MTIEEMKRRKKEYGYSNKTLAERSGVPLGTLQKIFSGATSSPREETIRALEIALQPNPKYDISEDGESLIIREPVYAYGEKKFFTLDDYLALPDNIRVELIDGVFYDMGAPHGGHQGIVGLIHKILLDYVMENKGPCYPLLSPFDVQLDADENTVVQPDVMILCDKSKLKNGRVFGAPDFVAEVLSPSTKEKDMTLKLYKYSKAKVREYWMVDPMKKIVIQYDLEHMEAPVIYGFDAKVPVLIWDGKCKVDFQMISESTAFLWDS